MSNDELIFDKYEQMMGDALIEYEEHQSLLEEGYDSGYDFGYEDGINTGIEQKEKEMIKKMLEKKYNYDEISQLIGKTIEEVKKIEKEII